MPHSARSVSVWISPTRFATNVFHLLDSAYIQSKVTVESVHRYRRDIFSRSAGIITSIRRDKSSAAHNSNLGIEITFTGAIRDLAHINCDLIMPFVSIVRIYIHAPYAFIYASANPCVSICFLLSEPSQRGMLNELSSFRQLLYFSQSNCICGGTGLSQPIFSRHKPCNNIFPTNITGPTNPNGSNNVARPARMCLFVTSVFIFGTCTTYV